MTRNDIHGFRPLLLAAALAGAPALVAGCDRHAEGNADLAGPATATAPATVVPPASTAMPSPATLPTPATTTPAPGGPIADADFYEQALEGGRKEVSAAQAGARSDNGDVKQLATRLVTDHTEANRKLADALGGGASTAPDDRALADLEGKTGAEFDRAWATMMVADHEKAIALFENASAHAAGADARKLAGDTLPTLREHLKAAQDLQAKLGP